MRKDGEKMTENERVKELRKLLNLSQEEFGSKIGIQKTAISKIERGENGLTEQNRILICREYKAHERWLQTGEGEMFIRSSSEEVDNIAQKYNLSSEARILIERFLLLRPEVQQGIVDYILDAAAIINGEKKPEPTKAEKLAQYAKELTEQEEAAERSSASQTQGDGTKMA